MSDKPENQKITIEVPPGFNLACVFFLDPRTGGIAHKIEEGSPLPMLVNALEVVKTMCVTQQMIMSQQAAQRQAALTPKLVVPNGVNIRRQ